MRISLPPDAEHFIHEQIHAGQFASIDDLIYGAVRRLMEQEENMMSVKSSPIDKGELISDGLGLPVWHGTVEGALTRADIYGDIL